jgi:hypothetical protein
VQTLIRTLEYLFYIHPKKKFDVVIESKKTREFCSHRPVKAYSVYIKSKETGKELSGIRSVKDSKSEDAMKSLLEDLKVKAKAAKAKRAASTPKKTKMTTRVVKKKPVTK